MDINAIYDFTVQMLPRLPIVITTMIAAIIALARRSRHPQVSNLIVTFAVIEIATLVVSTLVYMQLPAHAVKAGYKAQDLRWIFAAVGFVHAMIAAGALSLLLWAALGWRGEKKTP